MTWIDKLERRFGHLAIPHLLRYVALLNALVFMLLQINPSYGRLLMLDPNAVWQGQVWRLLTHIFVPQIGGGLSTWTQLLFYLMFLNWLNWMGEGLEEAMGVFRLNLYYALGLIFTTGAAVLTHHSDGGFLLNNSLLLAFAWFNPDFEILAFYIIPIRVKWLAWIDLGLMFIYTLAPGWGNKIEVLASLVTFVLFFFPDWWAIRRHQAAVVQRREKFIGEPSLSVAETLHRCHVCGRTEVSSPELEFRVGRDGNEYCQEHRLRPPQMG